MEITIAKDSNIRMCAICKHRIRKGIIYVKHPETIGIWNDTRTWFGHIDCVIRKLTSVRTAFRKKMDVIPDISVKIGRYETSNP